MSVQRQAEGDIARNIVEALSAADNIRAWRRRHQQHSGA
jgi:hypothetical protein